MARKSRKESVAVAKAPEKHYPVGFLLFLCHEIYPSFCSFLPAVPSESDSCILKKRTIPSESVRSGYFYLLTTRPWDGCLPVLFL